MKCNHCGLENPKQSKFCKKCGTSLELPLATCNCDMPKGSVEEKSFIRAKLAEGHTEEQVIELLDKKYGHRV
jgi:cytochrome c-type biogenesis protein CcmH/NrfF